MIPIKVLHSSCQESLPPPTGAPPDTLPLLCSKPLVVEIYAGPLMLEKEGRAIQVMHRLLPLADDDDLPLLLLQLTPRL